MVINIAQDYTKTPGGKSSGKDFRERLLVPRFGEAERTHDTLTVVLDGAYGYTTAFLEEAFGGLAQELHNRKMPTIRIISDEEPSLVEKVRQYIEESL